MAFKPGSISVEYIALHSYKTGNRILLDGMVGSDTEKGVMMSFTESIFLPYITGRILVVDNKNLRSQMPLAGEELLEVSFITNDLIGKATPTKLLFQVTACYQDVQGSQKSRNFVLELKTFDFYANLLTRERSAYTGQVSDIVGNIYNHSIVPLMQESSIPLTIETTGNSTTYVAPNVNPFIAIKHLTGMAVSQAGYGDFMFYRDTVGLNFVSLGTLIRELKPIMNYRVSYEQLRDSSKSIAGESTMDTAAMYQVVQSWKVLKAFDRIERAIDGSMGTDTYNVDTVQKKITKMHYGYSDNFLQYPHLNSRPLDVDAPKPYSMQVKRVISNDVLFDTFKDYSAVVGHQRDVQLAAPYFNQQSLEVLGITGIHRCGTKITLSVPSYTQSDSSKAYMPDTDDYYTANYMVHTIDHSISLSQYKVNLSIFKEST